MFAIADTKMRREQMRFTSAHLQSDIYAITTKTNKKINSWEDIDKEGVIIIENITFIKLCLLNFLEINIS